MLCSCIGYAVHKLGIEKINLEFGDGEVYIDMYRKSYVSPRTYIPTFEALLSKKTALYSMTVARARYGSGLLCCALVYPSKTLHIEVMENTDIQSRVLERRMNCEKTYSLLKVNKRRCL